MPVCLKSLIKDRTHSLSLWSSTSASSATLLLSPGDGWSLFKGILWVLALGGYGAGTRDAWGQRRPPLTFRSSWSSSPHNISSWPSFTISVGTQGSCYCRHPPKQERMPCTQAVHKRAGSLAVRWGGCSCSSVGGPSAHKAGPGLKDPGGQGSRRQDSLVLCGLHPVTAPLWLSASSPKN